MAELETEVQGGVIDVSQHGMTLDDLALYHSSAPNPISRATGLPLTRETGTGSEYERRFWPSRRVADR